MVGRKRTCGKHAYSALSAEVTDELGETVCYAQLSEKVLNLVQENEYKLVEKLARDIHTEISSMMPKGATFQVRVHKLKPPIDILTRGVFYSVGDLSL